MAISDILISGDTVHMDTYDERSLGAEYYTDTMGLDRPGSAKYKVKVGGKAQTTSSTYYCKWNSSNVTTNTLQWLIYTTDSAYQCNFAH